MKNKNKTEESQPNYIELLKELANNCDNEKLAKLLYMIAIDFS